MDWRELLDTIERRIIESELVRLGVPSAAPCDEQFARAFEAALPRLRRYDPYWVAKTAWPVDAAPRST